MYTENHRPRRRTFRDEAFEYRPYASRKNAGGKRRKAQTDEQRVDWRRWQDWLDD